MRPPSEILSDALAQVEAYCDACVPRSAREELRVECSRRGRAITIVERRPPWRADLGPEWTTSRVAQLRLDPALGLWSLHAPDRKGRWFQYEGLAPATRVGQLLAEIEADPTGIFWG
jgi:hypothetical protein